MPFIDFTHYTHPGKFLRKYYLGKLTVTDAAKKIGVTRKTLSELLNGKSGISVMMALRLEKVFEKTAESWLIHQMNYDLRLARITLIIKATP